MAEETEAKEEDLSVEDILSSIKDILMEDNAEQQKTVQEDTENASEEEEKEDTIATPEETADDVLTLSPSMIVEPSLSTPELNEEEKKDNSDPLDIDFEREFNALSAEPDLDEVEVKDNGHSASVDEEPVELEEVSEKKDEEIEQTPAFRELNDIRPADVDAEPIFSAEDDISQQDDFSDISLDNLVDDATLNAILDNQPEDPIKPEDFVEPTDNVYENAVFEENVSIEPEANKEQIKIEPEEPKENISQPQEPEMQVAKTESFEEEAIEDTADVSAGIISNFAKMFAEQQKQKQEPENKEEAEAKLKEQVLSQIDMGDGSLSIEVLVRDVINAIVEKHLSKDYDFSAVAAAEIARQTKNWLNAHLPEIVEAEVKKEIERVMAKVSS